MGIHWVPSEDRRKGPRLPSQPIAGQPHQSHLPLPDQTPESIAAAKAACARERAVVTAQTGITFDEDGRIALLLANVISAAVWGPRGAMR